MATRSLGTLTLDIIAKVGGFVSGMDAAERRSEKWRKEVERMRQGSVPQLAPPLRQVLPRLLPSLFRQFAMPMKSQTLLALPMRARPSFRNMRPAQSWLALSKRSLLTSSRM